MSCGQTISVEDSQFQKILKESELESREELQESISEHSLNESAECLSAYENGMNKAGLNVELLQAEEASELENTKRWVQDVRPALITAGGETEVAKRLSTDELGESHDLSLIPTGFTALEPIGATEIASDTLQPQAWLYGGSQDLWVKAWGGGWGCTGGVGSITRYLTWWFSYTPPVNKFYAINPYVRFSGFYITKANDKWYNCKNARGRIQIKVNAYQYNWKGENTWTVLDSQGGNINVNRRFDTTRKVYYSALLGARDRVWIRVKVGLYARAQGSGSYSELNFATGNANHMSVPYLWIG